MIEHITCQANELPYHHKTYVWRHIHTQWLCNELRKQSSQTKAHTRKQTSLHVSQSVHSALKQIPPPYGCQIND
jgi:hypothetical protein